MKDNLIVLDTETSGFELEEGAALLEIATIDLVPHEALGYSINGHKETFVEFEGEIPPEARAVHHIHPDQVRPGAPNCRPRDVAVSYIQEDECFDGSSYYVAHNAGFDSKFFPEIPKEQWICTWRCSLHLFPDAPSHKNQVLRYYLGVEPQPALIQGLAPHRALYDIAVTSEILKLMLRDHSVADLARLSTTPVLLKKCNFGKHRGDAWADVPRDYLRWMRRAGVKSDDMDVQHTIDFYLG